MTKEDKELLLRDLCCRLPYNVKVSHDRIPPPGWMIKNTWIDGYLDSIEPDWSKDNGYNPHIICSGTECGIADVKPYLRPMSSMTKEEQTSLLDLLFDKEAKLFYIDKEGLIDGRTTSLMKEGLFYPAFCPINIELYTNWLNQHHFDYRDLISKGLALEAPSDMYENLNR